MNESVADAVRRVLNQYANAVYLNLQLAFPGDTANKTR